MDKYHGIRNKKFFRFNSSNGTSKKEYSLQV